MKTTFLDFEQPIVSGRKIALIEKTNPDWDDLWEQWFAPEA